MRKTSSSRMMPKPMRNTPRSRMVPKPAHLCLGIAAVLLLGLLLVMACSDSSTGPKRDGPEETSYCELQPLPAPTGTAINVSTSNELKEAVNVANNDVDVTIMLADGVYPLDQGLFIHNDNVTIRSASGNRDSVTIGGGGMEGTVHTVISFEGNNFTLADVTIGYVRDNALLVLHDSDDCLIHNVRFVDTGEYMLKVAILDAAQSRTERGVVEWCLFEYTAGEAPQMNSGGIMGTQADAWVVRHNTFRYIDLPGSEMAGYAIFFWQESSNTVVEQNTIYQCDRGIAIGWGSAGGSHTGGMVRNNMIHTTRSVGITLQSTVSASVYNNSIWLEDDDFSIHPRFATTQYLSIINNLTNAMIFAGEGATGVIETNFTNAQLSWFVDPAGGDLRLADSITTVCEQGQSLSDVEIDFDCEERPKGDFYDLGADEY
jgi:hypothetical protein